MKVPALLLAAALISLACTVIVLPKTSRCRQGPVKTFDPLALPKDSTARPPFLDPTALHADQVYLVRPLQEATGTGRNAEYVGGERALVGYLKQNVLLRIQPGIGWLVPPVVHFTIDAQGAVGEVAVIATSGNEGLDTAMVRIFQTMPAWEPARDAQGRAVQQAFEFRVGKGGC